jgi:hypothetical protein
VTSESACEPPPGDLGARGAGFWCAVVEDHELRPDELVLLAETCRQLDLLDALREVPGPLVTGDGKVHPAVVEARQVRAELRRFMAQLNLPDADADAPLSAEVQQLRSHRARRAARARWDRPGA